MLVGKSSVKSVMEKLAQRKTLALDCEATGLHPFLGARLFSIVIHDGLETYYFNFQGYDGVGAEHVLPYEILQDFEPLTQDPDRTWILANAKYDMHLLSREGVELLGKIYDVLVMARVENNTHLSYSLDSCAKRIGLGKSDAVLDYIRDHGLWDWVQIPGKKTRSKDLHFAKVPLAIMQPYAEQDAQVTWAVYEHQQKIFSEWDASPRPIAPIVANEMALTKVCYQVEKRGILLDRNYCQNAIAHEESRMEAARGEFFRLAGVPFVDSRKTLTPVFESNGLAIGKTEKGNDSFTDDVLAGVDHPLARAVQSYRDAAKRANTYYKSFLFFADPSGVVHPNIRQSATATGRFAITDPALQTLQNPDDEKESGHETAVRGAFKARPGTTLYELDYKNMEFRAAIDQSDELEMAEKIKAGHDVHTATGEATNIARKQAKILNFRILFGSGIQGVADGLGVSYDTAAEIVKKYYAGLPKLRGTIRRCGEIAKERGWIFNKFGRRYFFPDSNFAYKAFNHWDQGSCADAVKIAMVRIHEFLKDYESKMILQIHDSALPSNGCQH
jgi:DNA polymerase-1